MNAIKVLLPFPVLSPLSEAHASRTKNTSVTSRARCRARESIDESTFCSRLVVADARKPDQGSSSDTGFPTEDDVRRGCIDIAEGRQPPPRRTYRMWVIARHQSPFGRSRLSIRTPRGLPLPSPEATFRQGTLVTVSRSPIFRRFDLRWPAIIRSRADFSTE